MPAAAPAGALARCTDLSVAEFAAEHWGQRPLLTRAKQLPEGFEDLLALDDVDNLVADRALRTPFFRTVSNGDGLPAPVRSGTAGSRRLTDLVDPDQLYAQQLDGSTLVLQSLHRLHPAVGAFCRALADELGHAVQCNAYLTPGGDAQGFAFHHDTHDVFVLQVAGRKRWLVHEPVLPLPLPSQPRSGSDLVPAGAEPLIDVELEAGDCLYLPRGFVHAAQTTDEQSVHLTVGVLLTTVYDVLDDALSLASLQQRFRESLPIRPTESITALLPDLLREAADWLSALEPAPVEELVRARLQKALPVEPLRPLAQAGCARDLSADTWVRPRRGLATVTENVDDRVMLRLPDRTVSLPAAARKALEQLLRGPATPGQLEQTGLTATEALVVVRRLLREAVVVPR